jgi:hypothetical protein
MGERADAQDLWGWIAGEGLCLLHISVWILLSEPGLNIIDALILHSSISSSEPLRFWGTHPHLHLISSWLDTGGAEIGTWTG